MTKRLGSTTPSWFPSEVERYRLWQRLRGIQEALMEAQGRPAPSDDQLDGIADSMLREHLRGLAASGGRSARLPAYVRPRPCPPSDEDEMIAEKLLELQGEMAGG